MRDRLGDFEHLGAGVVAVSLGRPEQLAAYRRTTPWPFPVVCDPERAAYRLFGLERTRWRTFFRPGILVRYLRLMTRGWRLRAANAGEDLLQLGGDFVIDRGRRLVYAYRSAEPTDRPPVAALLDAVRSAGGGD